MAGENFQIDSVQITGKCICETFHFSSPLHLIINLHVKHPPINLPKKVRSAMQSFSRKTLTPFPYFWRIGSGRHYSFSSYIFPFLKVSSLTFMVQTMTFQAKLPTHCVFNVIQYVWL